MHKHFRGLLSVCFTLYIKIYKIFVATFFKLSSGVTKCYVNNKIKEKKMKRDCGIRIIYNTSFFYLNILKIVNTRETP